MSEQDQAQHASVRKLDLDATVADPHGKSLDRRVGRRRQRPAGAEAEARPVARTDDLVVTSTATRALATARAVARELGYREDLIVESPELYLADPDTILDVVRRAPTTARTLLVVGHNPGFTELANLLDDVRLDNMPTAGMLCTTFEGPNWAGIDPAEARFDWFDCPKQQPA
jgi:phosphohistidine phosphatase SixA